MCMISFSFFVDVFVSACLARTRLDVRLLTPPFVLSLYIYIYIVSSMRWYIFDQDI